MHTYFRATAALPLNLDEARMAAVHNARWEKSGGAAFAYLHFGLTGNKGIWQTGNEAITPGYRGRNRNSVFRIRNIYQNYSNVLITFDPRVTRGAGQNRKYSADYRICISTLASRSFRIYDAELGENRRGHYKYLSTTCKTLEIKLRFVANFRRSLESGSCVVNDV